MVRTCGDLPASPRFPHAWERMSAVCPDRGFLKMIVDCAYYQDGFRQGESSVPLEEAAARRGQDGFVWLGCWIRTRMS